MNFESKDYERYQLDLQRYFHNGKVITRTILQVFLELKYARWFLDSNIILRNVREVMNRYNSSNHLRFSPR
jgi:hypothetical protein